MNRLIFKMKMRTNITNQFVNEIVHKLANSSVQVNPVSVGITDQSYM